MNTITKIVVLGLLCLITSTLYAQTDSLSVTEKQKRIEKLETYKSKIETEEREALKQEVEAIMARLEKGEITQEKADDLKREAAKLRASNIENRVAIINNQIELVRRNDSWDPKLDEESEEIRIFFGNSKSGITIKQNGDKVSTLVKYDLRTTNDFLFAIGVNNAIIEGQSLDDSPFEKLGSGFVELGWNWNTRIFKNSNIARIKYGFSFQWNKLNAKDNLFVQKDGDVTTLAEFPQDLRKSQFRTTNLVFPVYLEFGSSKVIQKEDRIRYDTDNSFKFGIGGYAGFNIGTQQKLKYSEDGDRVKQKIRTDYNTNDFIYGLGAYVGVGDVSLYAKYDLNTIFKDQATDFNNVSLGLRFDID